ncbi:hypothetical protein PAPHI01_1812 [Pancytospora philotis]|nr:hypothetical protein PAPHI01_1812 [Pancytospora philotis]
MDASAGASPYARLEAFRKATLDPRIVDEEPIYDYIRTFQTADQGLANQFLEILADFLLTMSYALRHRSARIIADAEAMGVVLSYAILRATQYNAQVVLGILSSSPEIASVDPGLLSSMLADRNEACARLKLKILANMIRHGVSFTRQQQAAVLGLISSYRARDSSETNYIRIINEHYARSRVSLSQYLDGLKRNEYVLVTDRDFWTNNLPYIASVFSETAHQYVDCICNTANPHSPAAARDFLTVLRYDPRLRPAPMAEQSIERLYALLEVPDEDLRYAVTLIIDALMYSKVQD